LSKGAAIASQAHSSGEIIIEDDVWIGANAVILRNVRLGQGCVVAAGAVVTKDVAALVVVGGVPARKISLRV
jgi:acetyltransferase-like isoleucine patch superfamily enzyme